jgi:hypothetical protein
MKGGFRQYGFARQGRPLDPFRDLGSPTVVRIVHLHERDKEACIHYGFHFREYPLREERSGGPSLKMPTYLRQA